MQTSNKFAIPDGEDNVENQYQQLAVVAEVQETIQLDKGTLSKIGKDVAGITKDKVQQDTTAKPQNDQKIASRSSTRRQSPRSTTKNLNPRAPDFIPSGKGTDVPQQKESTSQWVNKSFVQKNLVTTNQSYQDIPLQSEDTFATGNIYKNIDKTKLGGRLWCNQTEEVSDEDGGKDHSDESDD